MTTALERFPATGGALPDYSANGDRVASAAAFMMGLYVPSPAQEALIAHIEVLRRSCLGRHGTPLPGRRLLQESQAGKTSVIREFGRRLAAQEVESGRIANPYRALHVELKLRITVKMLYQRILHELGDTEADGRYNVDTLMQRCAEFMRRRGTELLFIDEVQYLAKDRRDSREVADELKGFLDQGLVPICFMGNQEAEELFVGNPRLTGRLGAPLRLPPADSKVPLERREYRAFIRHLDEAISKGGHCAPSGLASKRILARLHRSSGGHLGRSCRIVEAALEHACARGAERIEEYDLSHAVDHLAIPSTWTIRNPFPRPESW